MSPNSEMSDMFWLSVLGTPNLFLQKGLIRSIITVIAGMQECQSVVLMAAMPKLKTTHPLCSLL